MNTLKQLKAIEKEKCIYNIHYCLAGVGFVFYYPERDKSDPAGRWQKDNTNNGLSIDKYYPSFEEAVDAEYKKLDKK